AKAIDDQGAPVSTVEPTPDSPPRHPGDLAQLGDERVIAPNVGNRAMLELGLLRPGVAKAVAQPRASMGRIEPTPDGRPRQARQVLDRLHDLIVTASLGDRQRLEIDRGVRPDVTKAVDEQRRAMSP